MSLVAIELAVQGGAFAAALERAVWAWRARRHPELAELVTLLAARAPSPPIAPRSTTSREFHEAWLAALEREPIASLGAALTTLTRALPFGPGQHHLRYRPWFERLEALERIPDPRIAAAHVELLERLPFRREIEQHLYRPLFAQLASLGDARALDRLEAIAAGAPAVREPFLRALLAAELPVVLRALAATSPAPLDDEELGTLDRVRARLGAPARVRAPAAPARIDAIVAAVEAGHLPDALAAAVGAWRASRAPELADLVDALDAKLALPPLAARSAPVFQEVWLIALAADPVLNLGPVLRTLTRALPLGTTDGDRGPRGLGHCYAPWFARLAALAPVDDPRIATAFAHVLATTPFRDAFAGPTTAYDPLFARLAELGDPRQLPSLRALAATPLAPRVWLRELLAARLPPLVAALESRRAAATSLTDDERARVVELVARLAPSAAAATGARSGEDGDAALLALVAAAPDEDDAREVLADRWLERGDPRGELVTLQLREARGTATDHDRRRAAALVRRHAKTWLGPLAAVTTHRRFARGFLDAVTLASASVAAAATWQAAALAPALATVRFVDKGAANEARFRELALAAPNLRAVAVVSKTMLAALVTSPPPRLAEIELGFPVDPRALATLVATLPALRSVELSVVAGGLARAIDGAAAALAARPGLRVAIRPAPADAPLSRYAGWLRAGGDRLAAYGGATLRLAAGEITARAGAGGLRLELRLADLTFVDELLAALGPIEHVALAAPDGEAPAATSRALAEALLRRVPRIELDAAWRRILRPARSR